MAEFIKEKKPLFLSVVRKYMELRGSMTQKDLAELTKTGVSTMSRFFTQQNSDVNAILVAKIVAYLEIPLHEMIDYVDESFSLEFTKLVKIYQATENETLSSPEVSLEPERSQTVIAPAVPEPPVIKPVESPAPVVAGDDAALLARIKDLPARQKAFLLDFLDLDSDGRDFMVDIGNSFGGYQRIKGIKK